MVNPIDNSKYYVEVKKDFTACIIEGGAAFWARPPEEISAGHQVLMVTIFESRENWLTQEMHPLGDEIITLMSGEVEFILNPGREEEKVRVKAGETIVIPKGTWHTAAIISQAVAQHILMGQGTQVKEMNK